MSETEPTTPPQNSPHIRTVAVVVTLGVVIDYDLEAGKATVRGCKVWTDNAWVDEPTWSTGKPAASVGLTFPEAEELPYMAVPASDGWHPFVELVVGVGREGLEHLDALPERQATSCQPAEGDAG